MLSCLFLEFWLQMLQRRGNGFYYSIINGGGAELNKEHVLFNDVVCHKGSNCGLSVYYKLNLAILRLIFRLVLGIEDLAVRCGSNAQGEGVNVSSDSCSPHLHLQNFDRRAPLVLLRS